MAATTPRFTARTKRQLIAQLLDRHTVLSHTAESLRLEVAAVNGGRDVSDMLDHEEPAADSDTQTILVLAEQAECLLREAQEALFRAAADTYGYCVDCGDAIPVARLRALPAAATCVDCSRMASKRRNGSLNLGYVEQRLLSEVGDLEVAR